MKFKKKPVVIEAVLYDGENYEEVWDFIDEGFVKHSSTPNLNGLVIKTLEGEIHASVGDWIIKGVVGEFYPCRPDVFEATYERIDEEPAKDTKQFYVGDKVRVDTNKQVVIEGLEFSGDTVPIIFLENCDKSFIMLGAEELKEIQKWTEQAIEASREDYVFLIEQRSSEEPSFEDIFKGYRSDDR